MKKIFLVLVVIGFSLLICIRPGMAENVGNKICPVGGEAVDGMTTYEYQGKTYNFCCPMCIDEFKRDPAKYIEKVEKEGGMHEGHHH